jgi:hypothetical protein
MTQWARMIADDNGVFEVTQLHDEDPTGIWHPDELENWREVDDSVAHGDKLDADGKWHKGGDWTARQIEEASKLIDAGPLAPVRRPHGHVTKVELVNAGSNYETPAVRQQYNIGEGQGLVVEVDFDPTTEKATGTPIIHDGGWGYEVGQEFQIKVGFGRGWDRKNPDYTTVRITEIHDDPDFKNDPGSIGFDPTKNIPGPAPV